MEIVWTGKNTLLLSLFCMGCCLLACAPAVKPNVAQVRVVPCHIPEVPKAVQQPIPPNASPSQQLQIILNNCLQVRHENELLREAIKTCQ